MPRPATREYIHAVRITRIFLFDARYASRPPGQDLPRDPRRGKLDGMKLASLHLKEQQSILGAESRSTLLASQGWDLELNAVGVVARFKDSEDTHWYPHAMVRRGVVAPVPAPAKKGDK